MAEGSEGGGRYHPAVLTFRPDNIFTVGLMFVIVYLAGALLAQLAMRAGILPSVAPAAGTGTASPSMPVNKPAPGMSVVQ
jgi:hypothetical protein